MCTQTCPPPLPPPRPPSPQPLSATALRKAHAAASAASVELLGAVDLAGYAAALAKRKAMEVPLSWLAAAAASAPGGSGGDGEAISRGGGGGVAASRKDASLAQAARDVERDVLVVNGSRLAGAAGYGAVVSAIARAAAAAEAAAGLGVPGQGGGGGGGDAAGVELEGFAGAVLASGNRTRSGGDSVDVLCARAAAHRAALRAQNVRARA